MRNLLLLFLIVISTGAFAAAEPPSVVDLLQQAWQSERDGKTDAALSAYITVLSSRPDDPQINLKIAQLLVSMKRTGAAAPYLVKTLDLLQKDPQAPLDLKITVCSALMGRRPAEWRSESWSDYLSPAPYTALPEQEKQRLAKSLPESWMFPSKRDEMMFRLSAGEIERSLQVMKEIVLAGNPGIVQTIFMDEKVSAAQRKKLAESWADEAKKSDNPYLLLAAQELYVHLGDATAFREAYPRVLKSVKDSPALLQSLGDLCRRIGFGAGETEVRALPGGMSEQNSKDQIFAQLGKALDSGDREQTLQILRTVAVEYNKDLDDAFRGATLRKMVQLGWQDILVEFIQPELFDNVDWDIIMAGTVYNQPRFDYWMGQLTSYYTQDEHFPSFLSSTYEKQPPEHLIWLLEQSLRIFSDSLRLREDLAEAYDKAGYPDRALPIFRQLIMEGKTDNGAEVGSWLNQMWRIYDNRKKLEELTADLWNQRDSLKIPACLAVARKHLNEKQPEGAKKWLDYIANRAAANGETPGAAKRTGSYSAYSEDTYILRLQTLVTLDRKDDVQKLLAEAKKIYPNTPFFERVGNLNTMVEIDWNEEVGRLTKDLRQRIRPSSDEIPYTPFMQLAHALAKAGKADEARTLAEELMPAQKPWQDGFVLAVAMFRDRVTGVLPLVDWLKSAFSEKDYTSSGGSYGYARLFGGAITTPDDNSLAPLFRLAVALTAPETRDGNQLASDCFYNFPQNADDLQALAKELSSKKLSRYTLNKIVYQQQLVNDPPPWLKALLRSQTWCAAGLIMTIDTEAKTASEEEIRGWLDALESQEDWAEVDLDMLSHAGKALADRKLIPEAERLLNTAMKHLTEKDRTGLQYQLWRVSGKTPGEPIGDEADKFDAWLVYTRSLYSAKSKDTPAAARRALELAKTVKERMDVIYILAYADPAPFDKLVENFPVILESGDSTYIKSMRIFLFRQVEKDHNLAKQAAPLLDQAVPSQFDWEECQGRGLTHIWAGNVEKGVGILLPNGVLGRDEGLVAVFRTIPRADLPPAARTAIAGAFVKRLLESRVPPSRLPGLIGGIDNYGSVNSPEGISALVLAITEYLQKSEEIVPSQVLESSLTLLHAFASRQNQNEEYSSAWWPVVEAIAGKMAQSPEGKRTAADRINARLDSDKSSSCNKTQSYKRLKALADSLK